MGAGPRGSRRLGLAESSCGELLGACHGHVPEPALPRLLGRIQACLPLLAAALPLTRRGACPPALPGSSELLFPAPSERAAAPVTQADPLASGPQSLSHRLCPPPQSKKPWARQRRWPAADEGSCVPASVLTALPALALRPGGL